MEKTNQILDVLRLYEYAMSIGKSLDYLENCDSFLKLLLKRRNLNACWILSFEEETHTLTKEYSIPDGQDLKTILPLNLSDFLKSIDTYALITYNSNYKKFAPIELEEGTIAVYKLYGNNFLFLYSNISNVSQKDSEQILPVIHKFSNTLEACTAFKNREKLLKELKKKNKELNEYAHIVSHDLRSPLRNIETLITWLKEENEAVLNKSIHQYLNSISENITKMESLVSGILEYSTIGMDDFNLTKLDLNTLIKNLVQGIYVPKNIEVNIAPNLPTILGNKHRIQQVFHNLIDNAIKYNDKKRGVIEIGFYKNSETSVYYVKDNGKGIAPKYHTKIFNAFQKLENDTNSIGIGLSIVEKIITHYGGKIWLTSKVDSGSTFFFTFEN